MEIQVLTASFSKRKVNILFINALDKRFGAEL